MFTPRCFPRIKKNSTVPQPKKEKAKHQPSFIIKPSAQPTRTPPFASLQADSQRLERWTRPQRLPANLTVSRWLGFTRSQRRGGGPGGALGGRVCPEVECIVTQTMHYPAVLACLPAWQDNGSVTQERDSPSLAIQLRVLVLLAHTAR